MRATGPNKTNEKICSESCRCYFRLKPNAPFSKFLQEVSWNCQFCRTEMDKNDTKSHLFHQDYVFCNEKCVAKCELIKCTNCDKVLIAGLPRFLLRFGRQVRVFCNELCLQASKDKREKLRGCTNCSRDISGLNHIVALFISIEAGFKEFCSLGCHAKYKTAKNTIVLGTERPIAPSVSCSVCGKVNFEVNQDFKVFHGNLQHQLCSQPCMNAFLFTNKLSKYFCDACKMQCPISYQSLQYQGKQKRFCKASCIASFRAKNSKQTACVLCKKKMNNFDMIERVDAGNKVQLFCSLQCLSMFRVNLQAKCNNKTTCDLCKQFTPPAFHLTMSDATVRNFCSANCVNLFQNRFKLPQVASSSTVTSTVANLLNTPKPHPTGNLPAPPSLVSTHATAHGFTTTRYTVDASKSK